MLYPHFNDLLSYKNHRYDKGLITRHKVYSIAPGNHHSPFRGQGLDFDSVREYVPGDDIRAIDWRVTARTGSPHVKLFQEEKERHTIICVDMNSSMRFGTRNTFKSIQAARCASVLGWRALAHQDRISICLFGDVPGGVHYLASKHTRQTLTRMLKILTIPPQEQHCISQAAALHHVSKIAPPGSLIYFISDFMNFSSDFSKESRLSHLAKRCDNIFISINDAADQALVAAGIIGFCGQHTENIYVNTDSMQGRALYAAQWKENRQTLTTISERFNIPLITLSTESEIYYDLLLGLKLIAKGKKCLL